jgi:hypothetical protein
MPKIIFTSRYIKGGSHAANLMRYIATRKGVEAVQTLNVLRPATEKQRKLIDEIMRQLPDVKMSFEYADYITAPTIGNASELITSAFETSPELWSDVRGYVDYIAKRPGAERSAVSGHGLFGASDTPQLSQVTDEVANYKGRIWTHVISLRREDAERLGFMNAAAWRTLVASKLNVIADAMRIPLDNLVWYGSFHNKETNPHIHLMVYSKNPKEGYLTEPQIEKMRSAFASDIFKDELLHIYERKDVARVKVKEYANTRMDELIADIQRGGGDPELELLLARLSVKLKQAAGKKQYGYLRPEVKRLVDEVVTHLAADPRIAEMYEHWRELSGEVRRLYTSAEADIVPLTDEPTFKSVKNMVVQFALRFDKPNIAVPDVAEEIVNEPSDSPRASEHNVYFADKRDNERGGERGNERSDERDGERNVYSARDRGDVRGGERDNEHAAHTSAQTAEYARNAPHSSTYAGTHRPQHGSGANLLLALARLLRDDYQQQQRQFEHLADRKLMSKIRRKKQELGQKFGM